ncbi:alanyl-tRNA editing protein [Halofilum ochraceum]|uniref:alanyl-tRNA editing protein n=1 Tax=Halofilum ochraceum TaxID=1611323 RepID=UPI00082C57FE|nr:alanyl-tRNA editing protein [Halofilum ochraceum]
MTTALLFRESPYETRFEATVEVVDDNAVVLDRTLFYPHGGGQPGDSGTLTLADGSTLTVADTRKGDAGAVLHHISEGATLPAVGDRISGEIDWSRRHAHMRMHTCMHLLSVAIPAPVTGGSVGADKGRLDFDLPESTLDRETVTESLNALIAADHPVTAEWIAEAELDVRPELVKTLSVQPPRGEGDIRLIRIGDIDLQPCGGTHVARTAEIGRVRVAKIEKKSRHNRRVSIVFDPDG